MGMEKCYFRTDYFELELGLNPHGAAVGEAAGALARTSRSIEVSAGID